MGEIVNLDVTTLEESVSVTTTDGGTVEVAVQAEKGDAATISVGTTTTGNAGTNASVTNSGTTSAAVFNFTIPRGAAGPNTVTSATTTNFAETTVLISDGTNVSSLAYTEDNAPTSIAFRDSGGNCSFNNVNAAGILSSLTCDIYEATNTFYNRITSVATANRANTLPDASGTIALTTSNVATATALQTARTINGVSFNGTANITITVPVSTGITGMGTGVATALAVNVGSAGAFVVNGGALGTPSSGTLTSCTGLPISTGVSGLAANVATFLATPSSANLAAAVTDETGNGSLVFAISPTITTPTVRGGGTGLSNAFVITDSAATTTTRVTDNGNIGVGGYVPSGHLATSGYRGVWLDSSNSGLLGETTANFRGANIVSNVVRANAGQWGQQDATRNSFILSVGYESSNNGLNLFRAAAGAGNTFSNIFGINDTGQLTISGNQIRITTSQTPASASATGTAGTVCWDANYIYVCTATNTWKRVAIATW